ncbi:PREDICTED: probable trans-2-enoyl-CoA reductase, mitochondrial [Nicrophorus vespilloides]|uniref:Enoyl-[acyl-carrier-protein] reductase, mitochondrial n=1 Tax=Nicrophorus vespilloides TaxID=110193 RepID=A0ABM1M751_NICVS|nr:PREDICTED: probable trans-2-enoyl-CoA reductase, mitochondrial [Nicrophorus vespilloides]
MALNISGKLFGGVLCNGNTFVRFQSVLATKLMYAEYGDPCKVVQKCEEPLPDIKGSDVLIRMLAAPVNPADINTIQGKYPSRPELPAVPGNEGVGEVVQVGSDVTDFCPGDRIVPLANLLGTWRSHAVLNSRQLLKIPKELGIVEASTLTVNPCTAYRMLKDFADLKEGDVVIQNGANSACGQNVIQLANIWGLKTVNIVRDRPKIGELRNFLKQLGATEVLTEEELRKTDLFKSKKLPKPKLGLNCVGGKNALEVMRHLNHGSSIVTYGGMSREPVTVPTSALIFKDIKVRGFWMTEWTKRNVDSPQRKEMFEELIKYMCEKKLHGPAYKMVEFQNFREALMNTMTIKGMIGLKYILDFEKC